jgi:hypothetical protein
LAIKPGGHLKLLKVGLVKITLFDIVTIKIKLSVLSIPKICVRRSLSPRILHVKDPETTYEYE